MIFSHTNNLDGFAFAGLLVKLPSIQPETLADHSYSHFNRSLGKHKLLCLLISGLKLTFVKELKGFYHSINYLASLGKTFRQIYFCMREYTLSLENSTGRRFQPLPG